MPRRVAEETILVIGMGRFGFALATTLMTLRREVLVIERDPALVAKVAPQVTLAVEGDATSKEMLESLGVTDIGTAVVAVGTSLEASLLATAALSELKVPNILAKAVTEEHAAILRKVGATHVVLPEIDMGKRVAHRLSRMVQVKHDQRGGVQTEEAPTGEYAVVEYMEFENYAIAAVKAPTWLIGQTVAEAHLMSQHGVSAFGIRRFGSEVFEPATKSTRVHNGDQLVIAGVKEHVEKFTLNTG